MTNPETAVQSTDENPNLPERYREPKFTTFEDVMPKEWLVATGEWLHSHRGYFKRGDTAGADRFNFELIKIDEVYEPIVNLRKAIVNLLDQGVEQVGIPDFDLEFIEFHATLYHHGSHFIWHTDREGYNGQLATTRRLSFCYYMHTDPRMFNGGELEFLDGTLVESTNNRLVLFDPLQQHRVRRVECWSADFIHGRWAIFGWVHGRTVGSTDEPLEGEPLTG